MLTLINFLTNKIRINKSRKNAGLTESSFHDKYRFANGLKVLQLLFAVCFLQLYSGTAISDSGDFDWECPAIDPVTLEIIPDEFAAPHITVEKLTTGHLVSWDCDGNIGLQAAFPGASLKGYEVRYLGESQSLTFGANGSSWLDNIESHHALGPYTARCNEGSYGVRVVSKKRRGSQYESHWVQAIGDDFCNTVENREPVAVINAPLDVDVGATFVLNGASSSDPDGDDLSWSWSADPVVGINMLTPAQENTQATIDLAESYTISLTVTDPDGLQHTDTVTIVAVSGGINQAPVVSAGTDITLALVDGEATTTLIGTVTDDARPAGSPVTQVWTIDAASNCGTDSCADHVVVQNATALSTTATFNLVGSYEFVLTADDGDMTDFDTVVVTVEDNPNPGGLGELVWIGPDNGSTIPSTCSFIQTPFEGLDSIGAAPLWATEFNSGNWQEESPGNVRWNTAYAWGPETIINNESQYYVDVLGIHPTSSSEWSPFVQATGNGTTNGKANEGYLVIQAAPTEFANRLDLGALGSTQPYLSGVMTSREQVDGDLSYGYFEARLRTAPGNGTWSAFWLNHTSFRKSNEPEADIIEYLGASKKEGGSCDSGFLNESGNPLDDNYCHASHPNYVNDANLDVDHKTYHTYDTQYHTYWYGKRRREERSELHYTNRDTGDGISDEWCGARVNFSEEFHKYGFLWAPNEMIWYIDDIEVMRVDPSGSNNADVTNMPIAAENMYLVLNLALGNDELPWVSWPGAPDEWTRRQFNAGGYNKVSMAIDYVRVYSIGN